MSRTKIDWSQTTFEGTKFAEKDGWEFYVNPEKRICPAGFRWRSRISNVRRIYT